MVEALNIHDIDDMIHKLQNELSTSTEHQQSKIDTQAKSKTTVTTHPIPSKESIKATSQQAEIMN